MFLRGQRRPDPDLLDRMTDSMAHRGPDGRGTFLAPGCGLGHRRLAIIDLDGGAQPLRGGSKDVWIAFNGEVYNYADIRTGLPGPWRTKSDTEVFLRAYETHGLDGLQSLVGMWGAAIWDGRKRELVVVRDRLGVKPVYYAELANATLFASEIRALLCHPDVRRDIDPVALDQLLTYRYVPSDRTMFAHIKKLRAGHAAIVGDEGLRIERYWSPRPNVVAMTDSEAEEAFSSCFDDSVRARMVSDVPVGLFLSGGIDSAGILQSMEQSGVHTFTIGFEGGEKDDEIPLARKTAELFDAEHHTIVIGPRDYAGYLDEYAAQLEEPVLNDSAIATHFLSKLARETVKVVLSGQGADEPLAGYDRYKGEYLSRLYRRLKVPALLEPIVAATPLSEKIKRAFRSLGESDDLRRAIRIYAVIQEEDKRLLIRPELAQSQDVSQPVSDLHQEVPHLSSLGRMIYTDTRMWLVDELLLIADKLSMAHGLELRVPFLDHRLIELIESMPDDQKLRLGRRGFETKRVHRATMAKRLPREIIGRKKLGFTNPMDLWLRNELRDLAEERLLSSDSPLREWMLPTGIETFFREHNSGRRDRRRQLFLLLTLDAWARSHLSGGPPGLS